MTFHVECATYDRWHIWHMPFGSPERNGDYGIWLRVHAQFLQDRQQRVLCGLRSPACQHLLVEVSSERGEHCVRVSQPPFALVSLQK